MCYVTHFTHILMDPYILGPWPDHDHSCHTYVPTLFRKVTQYVPATRAVTLCREDSTLPATLMRLSHRLSLGAEDPTL